MDREQLTAVCVVLGVVATAERSTDRAPHGFSSGSSAWRVRLTLEGRTITVPFFMGPACKGDPTAADVLSSLVLDTSAGEQSFKDFCLDFGYDANDRDKRREALTTWNACRRLAPRVRKLLGPHFDRVVEAEH